MFKGRRKAAIVWWLEDVLWTILNQSSAGRNARADSFINSAPAHENDMWRKCMYGYCGFSGFRKPQ